MVHNDSITEETHIPMVENVAKGVDEGRYRLVGWAIDTTGRRLIDEICQIAAYTPDSQFSQYIMPFNDIKLLYRKRHAIRVITMGRYRMLKDLRTNKFVKTKSEITALTDFVSWLEQNRGDATDGIILLYHEVHKSNPGMLLEALKRHGLVERFGKVVKGFSNCYGVLKDKCVNTMKVFNLRITSRVLLNKDEDLSSAATRAQTCYNIVVHLGQSERQDLDAKGSGDCKGNELHLVNLMRPYTNPIVAEEEEIVVFKELLERQNTFKPVFGAFLRSTPSDRQHAAHLRRILAENNIDYAKLNEAFQNGAKDGLEKLLKTDIPEIKDEDLKGLVEIMDCFFDPEKKPVEPKPFRYHQNGRPRRTSTGKKYGHNLNNNNNNVSDGSSSPIKKEPMLKQEPIIKQEEVQVA